MFWRVRLKLAAWSAGALGAIVLILGVTIFGVVRHSLDGEIDDSLTRARDELLLDPAALVPPASTASSRPSVLLLTVPSRPPADPPVRADGDGDGTPEPADDDGGPGGSDDHQGPEPDDDDIAAVIASDVFFVTSSQAGDVIWNPRGVGTSELPLSELAAAAGDAEQRTTVDAGDERLRIATVPLPSGSAGDAAYLFIGRSLAFRDQQLRDLAWILFIGGVAGVALSAAGGFVVAGRALVPIRSTVETQRRFVSDASHELRTPLSVVRANAELLARHPDRTIEDNLEQLEAIESEVNHMSNLVGDLLTLARADEGRLELVREQFALDQLLDEIVRDMAPLAAHRDIHIETSFDSTEVNADRARIRQLAVILLDNALKFTPDAGAITVRSNRTRGGAEFSVADSGPGIPTADQARIFDRFYRVSTARGSTSPGGTGLGLAIARWIAEAHGGRISVDSDVGKGARFTVRLAN